jgi:PIN domain-containing protein
VAIVYVETNFLIGLAFGQDLSAGDLLVEAARSDALRLAIPSICFMEATSTVGARIHERMTLNRTLDSERKQLVRNQVSPLAGQLLDLLGKTSVTNGEYADRIKSDFQDVVDKVRSLATIIPLTKTALKGGFARIIVEAKHKDLILPDNLIIHCILDHAQRRRADAKALLSGNSTEFSRPAVQAALKSAGIDKYFTDAKNALGWYRSQPPPGRS